MSEPQDTTQQAAPIDWAAEAKKYGGAIAAPTSIAVAPASAGTETDAADQAPIEKAPQGSAARVTDSINYGDSAKKYGGHITPAPQQSTLEKTIAGPGTAIGTEYKPFTTETSGLSDILHGNIKKGASEIWAAEAPHVIPGSPLEKLIQKVNPNFKGEGGPAPEKPLAKPFVDAAQFIDGDKHPMGKAIAETVQSFTSPESIAIMVSTGGLGMVESPAALGMANRLISRGFAVQSIAQAYSNFKQFKEAYDSGDGARAEYFLTHMVMSGAMGAMAAQHAETGKGPAENAWTKAGAKADAALGRGIGAAVKAVKGIGERAADLIPDKKPEITPAEHLAQSADNLYDAIKPGKSMVADDFRATLDEAMPQLSVIANKNPNVSNPVEAAKAIEEHRVGIEGQLKQKAADMRGLPEARLDGVEEEVQNALNEGWRKAERKYTSDEIERASASVMKMLGLETVKGENGMPEVNRVAPTPDLFGAENIRQRFADDTKPSYAAGPGNVPSAEVYAKQVAGKALREAIDNKFEEVGIDGVKEWRKQESALIAVRDALQDAAKRSEDAGKWDVWDALFKRKGWGSTPAIAGAVVGGAPGAILGELAYLGADWWRDQQANPNILAKKGWGKLVEAGPSEKAVIPGKKATIGQPELRGGPESEGFGDIENPNKGAAAVTPAPEYVHGGSKEGINEVRLKLGDEEKGGVYFTHEGDRASVNVSWLEEAERGKGHGQNLLLEAAKKAREQGAKVLTSDPRGETSRSAARVWEVLRDKGYPVEDVKMPNGLPGYSLDLSKLGEKAKAATVWQPEIRKARSVEDSANDFNKENGRPEIVRPTEKVDAEFGKRTAAAYETMQYEPTDAAVKKSYDSLKNDVKDQWDYATKKMGIQFEPWNKEGQPYASSAEMMADVKDNGHLYFFQGGDIPVDHPLAEVDPETGLRYNDMFRAVHDLFGHAAGEHQFGPTGERRAYLQHTQMFNPESIPALITETHGQNSWTNFGPHAELKPSERPFAENKAGLLSKEFIKSAGKTPPKELEEHPLVTALKEKFGSTRDPKSLIEPGASFLHPDGTVTRTGAIEHPSAIASAKGKGPFASPADMDKASFIDDTKSIRVRTSMDRGGPTLHISVPKDGITPEQIDMLKQAVGRNRYGDFVIERSDIKPETTNTLSRGVQNARPEDLERSLKEIGVHPENVAAKGWAENAVKQVKENGGFSINPRTGADPIKGKDLHVVDVFPEADKLLDHVATAEDIRQFHDENRMIFDKNTEFYIGGFKTDKGTELNISAHGTAEGAAKVGKRLDQQSIWNVDKGDTVDLGGTGKTRDFPGYSLEQRVRDLRGEKESTIGQPELRGKPKGSTTELLENPIPRTKEESDLFGDKVHKGLSVAGTTLADFQRTMGDWTRATAGEITKPSAVLKRAMDVAHDEINHWVMENGGEGKGWYRKMTNDAINTMKELHPQLEDPAHQGIFKALWAAHSYGNEPGMNMDNAERNLTHLEQTGKVAYDQGRVDPDTGKTAKWSGHSGNVYTLAKIQHLIDGRGEAGAVDWLTTKHTWPEIAKEFEAAGLNVYKRGIEFDENGKAYGAQAFGPKGGAFFLNLSGINDHTTVDIWGTRAMRRWEGRAGNPDTLSIEPKTGMEVDNPPTVEEMQHYRDVTKAVADKMGLDTDDVQALQWYYEHKLYEVHGVGEAARDYEGAARNVVANRKSGVQPRGNEGAGPEAARGGPNAEAEGLFAGNERGRVREPGDESEVIGQPQLKAMNIPSSELPEGHTTQSVLHHEWGHVLEAGRSGLNPVEIRSHLHPEETSTATTVLDFRPFGATKVGGGVFVDDIAPIFVDRFLPTYLGGGVVNSLIDGIPFEENTGLSGDVGNARSGLRGMGFTEKESRAIIMGAADKARNRLTGDPALDIIKKYAANREENLPDTYHASPQRVQEFLNEVKEARRGTKYEQEPPTGVGGRSEKPSGEVISQPELRGPGKGAEGNLRKGNGEKVPNRLNLPMAARIAGTAALGALAGSRKKEETAAQVPAETPGFAGYKTPTTVLGKPEGLVREGNINLDNRPVIQNEDGTHSSEYSTSFGTDKGEVLVPTIVNGKFLTPDGKKPLEGSDAEKEMFKRAREHYYQTGESMGIFDTPEHADAYAEKVHNRDVQSTNPLAGKTVDIPQMIDSAAAEFGIPSTLLQAQARLESKLNPHAVSKKGAKGVMQLMDPTARALGVTDPYDAEQSIRGGAKLMSDLHKQFGHWDRALAAYNWSPDKVQGAIDKHGDRWLDHTPQETKDYVRIILGRE